MTELCPYCRGLSKLLMDKDRCPICKCNRADYLKMGYENELREMLYLRLTWIKARNFKQMTTGVYSVDSLIVFLWGFPTQQFGKIPPEVPGNKVVAYSPDYIQGPIHLNFTKREELKLKLKGVI